MLLPHSVCVLLSQFADVFVGLHGVSFYIFLSGMVELTMRAVEIVAPLLACVTLTAPILIS